MYSLVMGRDHKLYYEAYNDASDLNGDGVLDVGYKGHLSTAQGGIDYYGYFDSHRCYSYDSGRFKPGAAAPNKTCSNAWSGDFLNYLTTSRMDALRKVLYGGYRSTDTTSSTILERAYIPQDAHTWGKEYTSQAVDGYNLRDYAPVSLPDPGRRVLFANVTLRNDEGRGPLLRVLTNTNYRIWHWVAKENPVAGDDCQNGPCAGGGTSNHPGHPASRAAFDTMESTFAIPANQYGTDYTGTTKIDCTSNCNKGGGSQDDFLTIITGEFRTQGNSGGNDGAGTYEFEVAGDDVHDFELREGDSSGAVVLRVGAYGGGAYSQTPTGSVTLKANTTYWYKFRQEDATGGDGYGLRIRKTSGTNSFNDWRVFDSTINYNSNIVTGSRVGPVFQFYNLRPTNSSTLTDHVVRVEVCASGALDPNCKQYPNGKYKPTGILHDYGESDRMMFGLLTGSYAKNTQGGVLRKNMESFRNEVNSNTGQFDTSVNGIVKTINNLRTIDFNAYSYTCGWIANRPIDDGECAMWGNPIAEMMYEALRYLGGAPSPRSEFNIGNNAKDSQAPLNLPRPNWISPYTSVSDGGAGYLRCATPVMTVISDINPSYDGDVPGSKWSSISAASDPAPIQSLNVSNEVDAIWAAEGGGSRQIFIGESGGVADSNPTVKTVSNLSSTRGLSPEEPSKQGTYYSAGVARFGAANRIGGDKELMTYSVALASPLPKLEFPVAGKTITLVPFAKSPYGRYGGDVNPGDSFQPTNQIVDFFVETVVNTDPGGSDADSTINDGRPYARFRINYEDVEQGADHDMDAIVQYTLEVTADDKLRVSLNSEYASGSIVQYMGYVISGTTADGIYLEVSDCDTSSTYPSNGFCPSGSEPGQRYKLNTPPGMPAGYCTVPANFNSSVCETLPYSTTREFEPGSSGGAELLPDPLWYAAKYGRPPSINWDEDKDGTPDNYFLVTNAGTLKEQLDKAFAQIIADTRSSGGTAASGSRFNEGFMAYIPEYDTTDWTGDVKAYRINRANGNLIQPPIWSVANQLATQSPNSRSIYFVEKDLAISSDTGTLKPFEVNQLGMDADAQAAALGYASAADAGNVGDVVDYLRGDQTLETGGAAGGGFRARGSRLGDVLGSQPSILGIGSYGYSLLPESEGGGYRANGTLAPNGYVKFVEWKKTRTPVAFIGANDGMLHAIDASETANGGKELFAIVPRGVLGNLHLLPDPNYASDHHFFVDGSPEQGDAFWDNQGHTIILAPMGAGGSTILALDATDPATDGANFLWEFSHPDLGLTIGKPRIARWNNQWVAIFGNGYNALGSNATNANQAFLFIVDLKTGQLLNQIKLGSQGTADIPNGLATTFPVDLDGDADADLVYAGDYYGNLWRINLKAYGSDAALTARQLYKGPLNAAGVPLQPITGSTNASYHPARGQMVLFGTGKYFLTGDNAPPAANDPVNSFLGIWDDPLATAGTYPLAKNDLQEQKFVAGTTAGTRDVNATPVDWNNGQFGWYINLTEPGERFIGIPDVQLGRVVFTTFMSQGDECTPGGANWLNVLSAVSGSGAINRGTGAGGSSGSLSMPGGPPISNPPIVAIGGSDPSDDCTGPDCEPPPPDDDCDPEDPTCVPDCDPDTGECGTPELGVRGCETRVGVLTHLGIIDFDTFSCGRQSWRQYE